MQSSPASSSSSKPTTFRLAHRRQRSTRANDVQDANAAGRPFLFVPKRKCSSGSGKAREVETQALCASPEQDPPAEASSSRAFLTFPRAKSESDMLHGRLPDFEGFDWAASPTSPLSDSSTSTSTPTPTPTSTPKGPSHLNLDVARMYSASTTASTQADAAASLNIAGTLPTSAEPSAAFSTALIRKKSGELVKPSLKHSAFATWSGASRTRTKSAPSTPVGPKFVHFDAQLEHVKLFLAEQKPLAVSRDGSPTTSEGETDAFPFPPAAPLRIKPIALPAPPLAAPVWAFDVRLERLALEDAALVGHVLVRNVAFTKWVAARFTLDGWQTTSEVAARHVASLCGGVFDRFEFRVRLADYWGGIETKQLVLCVRYTVEGREMWDSNAGRNYEVGFERVKKQAGAPRTTATATAATAHWDVRRAGLDSMADLRKQLEKVVQEDHDGDGPPPPLATALHRKTPRGLRLWIGDRDAADDEHSPPLRVRSRSPSPVDGSTATPRSHRDTSARYDFATSFKGPAWTPPTSAPAPSTSKPKTTRLRTKPPSSENEHRRNMTIGFTYGPRGSSRDSANYADESVGLPHEEDRPRCHTRGWAHRSSYFERVAEEAPAFRKTPPGTPTVAVPATMPQSFHVSDGSSSSSSSSRSSSVSPDGSRLVLDTVWRTLHPEDESVASTPSMTSASTPSLSPLSPPEYLPRATSHEGLAVGAIASMSRSKRPPVDSTPYHSFLDQFCFFTGMNGHHGHSSSYSDGSVPRRTHSASSVEDYFTISPTMNHGSHSPYTSLKSGHTTPTRSPVPADFMSHRGFATPRPSTPNEFPTSPITTPVAG